MTNISGNAYHIHIDPDKNHTGLKLKEVWEYRELIWLFARKNLIVRYKQTVLGPLWLVLTPLFTVIMQTIIFGTVAGIDTEGLPKLLFYMAGNTLWTFFSVTVNRCANTFNNYAYLFGKVYFPRLTVPFSEVLLGIIEFLIRFVLMICICIWFSLHGTVIMYQTWLAAVPVLLWVGLLGAGTGLIVSGLTARYRDLRIAVSFILSAWMYATPVVYPLSLLKEGTLRTLVLLNPVTAPAEIFRHLLFGTGGVLPPWSILLSLMVTVVLLISGALIFNRTERNFVDTI